MWQTADYVIVVIVLSSANLPPPPPVVFLVVYSCCSVEANSFILHLTCFLFSSNLNSWLLICITVSVFIETYLQHERRNAHGFEREASRCFRKYALMSLLLAEVKAFTQLEKIIGFHNVTKLVSYMIFFFFSHGHIHMTLLAFLVLSDRQRAQ